MNPDILAVGGQLIGALLGQRAADPFKNTFRGIMGQAAGARAAGEAYGFNPLTLLGVSAPMAGNANYLGEAIAESGLLLADSLQRKKDELGVIAKLRGENKQLAERLQRQTLSPKVGGVYAQTRMVPTIRQALGVSNGQAAQATTMADTASASGGGVAGGDAERLAPLPESVIVDPRRKADNIDQKTHSGFMVIDNPYFGQLYWPSLDGDEAAGPIDLAMMGGAIGLKGAYRGGQKAADYPAKRNGVGPVMSVGGQRFMLQKRRMAEYFTHPQTGFSAKRRKP